MVWLRNKKTGGLFNTDDIGKNKKVDIEDIKKIVGDNFRSIQEDDNYKYIDGKIYNKTMSGWHKQDDRPVRVIGDYKIFARHFEVALPYTNYYIANIKTGQIFIVRDVPSYLGGTLKELTDNIKRGGPEPKKEWNGFNPLI